jgi:hypothetical protein
MPEFRPTADDRDATLATFRVAGGLARGDSPMMHRYRAVAALAFCFAAAVPFQSSARAQSVGRMGQPGDPTNRPQVVPSEMPRAPGRGAYPSGQPVPDGFVDEEFGHYGHPANGGYVEDYSGGYYPAWNDTCCDACGASGCEGDCWHRGGLGASLMGGVCPPGRYFVTADYL